MLFLMKMFLVTRHVSYRYTQALTSSADEFLGLVDLGCKGTGEESSRQPRLVHALLCCKRSLFLRWGGELEDADDLPDGLSDGHHYVVPADRGGGWWCIEMSQ